ncbi:response regulator [Candidatus Latescibacterota bacterium]
MEQKKDKIVLAVDDTVENIDILRSILGETYKVKVALSGEKALMIAAKKTPNIILLDIMMPEMDGYEVCRQLKADETTRDIPVIFVTGHQDEDERSKGLGLGAVDYITKPVDPEIVLEKVRAHLKA